MRSLLLASVAAVASGSPAPPPPAPERAEQPCPKDADDSKNKGKDAPSERRAVKPDNPSAAQRYIPGLF